MLRHRGSSFFTSKRKSKKRDFLTKRFKNPYFLKSRMPKRTRAPRLKAGLGIICLVGILSVFLFHPYFLVTNIDIKGNQTVLSDKILDKVTQVISKKRFLLLNGKNILITDTRQIKKELENDFIFQTLKISTKWPNTLNIKIQEKEAKMLLFVNQGFSTSTFNYFVLDGEGKIIRQSNKEEVEVKLVTLPKITIEKSEMELKLNEQVLLPANYEFIKFLEDKINNKNNITIDHYGLAGKSDKIINVVTGEGWKIIVDRQNDWQKQIQVLETILKTKIKDTKKLNYIDVRFENRSYFQ